MLRFFIGTGGWIAHGRVNLPVSRGSAGASPYLRFLRTVAASRCAPWFVALSFAFDSFGVVLQLWIVGRHKLQ